MSDETFDDLYDVGAVASEPQTNPLDHVILDAVRGILTDVHTALPAKIVGLSGNQYADVEILLQRKYKNGTVVTLPAIQKVPVLMPRGADYFVKLPFAVGDTGMLVFCERSLDAWKTSGGTVNPEDPRTHNFSDAIFIPGLYPVSDQVSDASTDLVFKNGSMEMHLQKAGTMIAKNDSNELMDLLDQVLTKLIDFVDTISQDTTNTIFGPMKLNQFVHYTLLKTQLDVIKTKFDTLKGS